MNEMHKPLAEVLNAVTSGLPFHSVPRELTNPHCDVKVALGEAHSEVRRGTVNSLVETERPKPELDGILFPLGLTPRAFDINFKFASRPPPSRRQHKRRGSPSPGSLSFFDSPLPEIRIAFCIYIMLYSVFTVHYGDLRYLYGS